MPSSLRQTVGIGSLETGEFQAKYCAAGVGFDVGGIHVNTGWVIKDMVAVFAVVSSGIIITVEVAAEDGLVGLGVALVPGATPGGKSPCSIAFKMRVTSIIDFPENRVFSKPIRSYH